MLFSSINPCWLRIFIICTESSDYFSYISYFVSYLSYFSYFSYFPSNASISLSYSLSEFDYSLSLLHII